MYCTYFLCPFCLSFYHYYSFLSSLHQSKGCSELGRLVALTSIDAHYSLKKAAMTLGIGSDNLILVNTDAVGR